MVHVMSMCVAASAAGLYNDMNMVIADGADD